MKYYDALSKLVQAYETRDSQEAALPSHIRIFHADPNIPAVDILVNGQKVIKIFHLSNSALIFISAR